MAVQRTLIGNIKGPKGDKGDTGSTGARGAGATVSIGSVTTTAYGGNANVTNSGTATDAVFDFILPQGAPGETVTDMQDLTLSSISQPSTKFPTPSIGDDGKTLFGKITKWFSDMTTQVATKLNAANVVNNLTTTASGYALDARMGKTLQDQITSLNGSLANYADGETITNVNDAPIGFSCIGSNGTNSPFPNFWCTILTMRGNSDSHYKQQIAFSWSFTSYTKIAYRVFDRGSWYGWNYFDNSYRLSSLTLASGLSWNGYQTLQIIGQVACMHINFWSNSALNAGTKITTLPSGYTYTFPAHHAVPVSGSTGTVCTFNVSSSGEVTIENALAANAHLDVVMIGRAV